MKVKTTTLPKKYHDAVLHWQRHWFKDYDFLFEHWDRYFPREPCFRLCAYREKDTPDLIQIGPDKGKKKYEQAEQMTPDQAKHLLAIIRAQASTEFGSIQQHQVTLDRAPSDEDRFWVMRVMAEELRHGYQMFDLLLSDDWSTFLGEYSVDDAVDEALSMTTGNHVLGAFNIDYDCFADSVVFAAFIDRVGKYQLTMQQVCAYRPMADSMPQMLREEAFHLAAGVVPMRRWVEKAAQGDPTFPMEHIQKLVNKWFPRGLEMFGHEKGGNTNLEYGFKDMANAEAQEMYADECERMLLDLNERYVRARLPKADADAAEKAMRKLYHEGETFEGIQPEDLLRLPELGFYRRRGMPAFEMIGVAGETFDDVEDYIAYLCRHLPEAYVAGRDFQEYRDLLRKVHAGEMEAQEAARKAPTLQRVGGSCPCSKSVRWVVRNGDGEVLETPGEPGGERGEGNGNGNGNGNGIQL